jgi:hypothetical protein
MIKKTKGIEMNEVHFHNIFDHIWFKCVFGLNNYEFWGCGFNKNIHFNVIKSIMHNTHDIGSRCNKKYLYLIQSGKLCMKH